QAREPRRHKGKRLLYLRSQGRPDCAHVYGIQAGLNRPLARRSKSEGPRTRETPSPNYHRCRISLPPASRTWAGRLWSLQFGASLELGELEIWCFVLALAHPSNSTLEQSCGVGWNIKVTGLNRRLVLLVLNYVPSEVSRG